MTITWVHFAIVCPLVLLGGFVDAIAGGGGFFSLTAYLLSGLPVHNAIATNKLSSCVGTSLATFRYIRRGFVPWKLAVICVPGALLGAFFGAKLALIASDTVFRWFMLLVLPAAGYYVLKKKDLDGGKPLEELAFGKTAAVCLAISLAFGVYDGFYGPGTGTFLLLLFSGAAKLDLKGSAGLGKIINWSTNFSSLGVYLFSGNVIYVLGLAACVFSLIGNYIGSGSFISKGNKLARPMILIVLTIFFGKLIYELATA